MCHSFPAPERFHAQIPIPSDSSRCLIPAPLDGTISPDPLASAGALLPAPFHRCRKFSNFRV